MARITTQEAQAWAETTKLTISTLDTDLLAHLEEDILRRVGVVMDTSLWVDSTTTPKIIRTAISQLYVSVLLDRQYSEDIADGSAWSVRLAAMSENIVTQVLTGTMELPGVTSDAGQPIFYPNDSSSAVDPLVWSGSATFQDTSVGDANFSIGMIF